MLAKYGEMVVLHRELWIVEDRVAEKLGDWVRRVFRQADSMRGNFYERFATRRDVGDVIAEVERLVRAFGEARRV